MTKGLLQKKYFADYDHIWINCMKIRYGKLAERQLFAIVESLYLTSPHQHKPDWDPITGEFSSKYKNSREEAWLYVRELRIAIEQSVNDGLGKEVISGIGFGDKSYVVSIRKGKGWYVFYKKYKTFVTVTRLISSQQMMIPVKDILL
jgi:hypothetical protein